MVEAQVSAMVDGVIPGAVAIGVVAHHKRIIPAWDMAQSVQASFLSVDRGAWGSTRNHLMVWRQLAQDYVEHRAHPEWSVVLEDDAVPCNNFREQLDMALTVAPTDVVGLYLGTGYPTAWQDFIGHVQLDPAHWYMTTHHLLHGVGTAIRTALVPDMLAWVSADSMNTPIDTAITEWCLNMKHAVAYTKPSLIDHLDGPTLINHPDQAGDRSDRPRRAWEFGTREYWGKSTVSIP